MWTPTSSAPPTVAVMNETPARPPSVSVVIPVRNEARHIEATLAALASQTYPRELLDIVVVDGRSDDATRDIVRTFAARHPDLPIRLLDNPDRIIPTALNLGICASAGEVIVRMDGHTIPDLDYVAACIDVLAHTGAEVVGGCISPHGTHPFERAVAVAQSSALGAGDAAFHHATNPAFVDTVYLGAFRRRVFAKVGLYDTSLLRNEDYELAIRLRAAGHRIYLDPQIRSRYAPRSNPRALARQYAAYGWWKVETLRRHPRSLRWRQALPPLFVAMLLVPLALAPWFTSGRWLLGLVSGLYLVAHVAGGLAMRRAGRFRGPGAPRQITTHVAIAIMHLAWGAGFLMNLLSGGRMPRRSRPAQIPHIQGEKAIQC